MIACDPRTLILIIYKYCRVMNSTTDILILDDRENLFKLYLLRYIKFKNEI